MFRLIPPRGRARRRFVASVPLALALLLAPAAAAAQEPERSVSAPDAVSGAGQLTLTTSGVEGALTVTVGAGTWGVTSPSTGDETLSVNLTQPDSGSAPRNGTTTLEVAADGDDDGPLLSAALVVDLTPPTPTLTLSRDGDDAHLSWEAVRAADEVTYVLAWGRGDGSWTTVTRTTAAGSHVQADLAPGVHDFRLTANVPSADGGTNSSDGAIKSVVIEEPEPASGEPSETPAEPDGGDGTGGDADGGDADGGDADGGEATGPPSPQPPVTEGPAAGDDDGTGGSPQPRPTDDGPKPQEQPTRTSPVPRKVTATGSVRRTVEVPSFSGGGLRLSRQPAMASDTRARPVPMPEVAGHGPVLQPFAESPALPPIVEAPETAPRLAPMPVAVPPVGGIAVEAVEVAQSDPADLLGLLAGVIFLIVASVLPRMGRRRRSARTAQT